jgi:uncharacterized membrane protein YfcA
MDFELLLLILVGFFAQLVDGALGMAFGVISTTAMLALGMPPAQASALVHSAEMFTTGASGAWHVFHGNVDWRLTIRLGISGVAGAVLGAWLLSNIDAASVRPVVSAYLLLVGVYILLRAAQLVPPRASRETWPTPVGVVAGFLDSSGGGWGPITTSWLIGAGLAPRQAIGSVNTAEFFVTVAAATTFLVELGPSSWQRLVPLALGGLIAAPFGGLLVKRIPARVLMFAVGVLIVTLAAWQIVRVLKLA